jgi:hypothetical protein
MRYTKIALLLLLTVCQLSCKGQDKDKTKPEEQGKQEVKTTQTMSTVLKQQLAKGRSALYGNSFDGPSYQYAEGDLAESVQLLKDALASNGYKSPSESDFNARVKEIFGRVIDPASATKFLYLNFDNACDKEAKFYRNENEIDIKPFAMYVVKKESFITELYAIPEIVDYKKKYPDLAAEEAKLPVETKDAKGESIKINYWKDYAELPEVRKKNITSFVARNMFLFNNSTAHALWLATNDKNFVLKLVKTFGYDKNPKFNELVIKEAAKENTGFLHDIIFAKNCQKELQIRGGLLQSYGTIFQEQQDVDRILPLKYYSSEIIENKQKKFSDAERNRIIAHLANTFDPLFKTNHNKNPQKWGDLTILADYRDFLGEEKWAGVIADFRRNNYYNLDRLAAMVEYANKFDAVGAPD